MSILDVLYVELPSKIEVDDKVQILAEHLVSHYSETSGIVKQLNNLGTLPVAGVELSSGKFAWIPEHCLKVIE